MLRGWQWYHGLVVASVAAASVLFYAWYDSTKKCKQKLRWDDANAAAVRGHPIVLVVDIGTSSIRCSAFAYMETTQKGQGVASKRLTYSKYLTSSSHHPFVDIPSARVQLTQSQINAEGRGDADLILAQVNHAVDEMVHFLRATHLIHQVVALGFTSFVMNMVGTNAEGRAITPLYTYADRHGSTSAFVKEYRNKLSARGVLGEVSNRTGTPIHSSYAPPHLLRLASEEPLVFKQISKWQTIAAFIISKWTGRPHTPISYSEASWMGMFDFRECKWSRQVLELLNVPVHMFPSVENHDYEIVGLTDSFRNRWPELKQIRLYLGVGDGAAANVGSKCTDSSRIAATIGTSAAMRLVISQESMHHQRVPSGLWCYRFDARRLLLGGALTDGGSILDWLQTFLNLNLFNAAATLTPILKPTLTPTLTLTWKAVEDMPPDAHQLTLLPFFSGERALKWHDDARGTIHGVRLTTRPADLLRAALEAVALRLAAIHALLAPFGAPDAQVIVSGTALQSSKLWRKILADCVGVPVVLETNAREATSRGVALLMRQSLFPMTTTSTAEANVEKERLDDEIEVAHPSAQAHVIYLTARSRQEDLYNKLMGP